VCGFPIDVETLENERCKAVLSNFGARLLELHVPDRDGRMADVVLGRPTLADAIGDRTYMGATCGRYSGRIAKGKFSLDGNEHHLAANEGANHLHGGKRGFDQYAWNTAAHADDESVTFTRLSVDGEEGYPGTLDAQVTYSLAGNALSITMTARCDRPTPVRLVNHAYWNLSGHDAGTILGHVLQLRSSFHIPTDEELIAHGEIRRVDDTPYDFRSPTEIGLRNGLIANSGAGRATDGSAGYDNVWVLDGTGMRTVGTLTDPVSGRRMELATNQPGVCFYAGGYLAGEAAKDDLETYQAFAGLCLESTGFPNDVNIAHFPTPVLRPGELYNHEMKLSFTADPLDQGVEQKPVPARADLVEQSAGGRPPSTSNAITNIHCSRNP
jgi:aldose 1-epimerase